MRQKTDYGRKHDTKQNMKKLFRIVSFLIVIAISTVLVMAAANNDDLGTNTSNTDTSTTTTNADTSNAAVPNSIVSTSTDMRGVWVATVLNIDYPAKPTTNLEALKSEAISILDNAKATGLNAVFLQVRPTSDALYKSKYFPWSKYLTGKQGLAPDGGFDPLEFWVTEAHKRGIELHAWINPYRITKKEAGQPSHDFKSLDPSNPAVLHPEWVVKHTDGNLYYNPGIPEVRKLIIDSVLEIVNGYDVDGIHFDDYFYPGSKFNDKATYASYGKGFTNIEDWRRENVNILIRDVYQSIKASGKTNIRFGISPFGIWANKTADSLGSDTKGAQSYYDHYADSRKWVKEGIIDYIIPQIYWNIGYSIADYSKLLNWWKDTVSGTAVDLYIGHAAYRTGNSSTSSAWYGISEIAKQLSLNEKVSGVKGSVFYNYKSLADNPALNAVVKAIYEQRDGMAAVNPVQVSRPSENIRTSYKQYYLNGASDPGKPLYLNGELIENRSDKGYFGVLATLSDGPNVFTVSQEASYSTRVIYKEKASSASQKMKKAEITSTSVFPQSQEYRTAGEKITLSCTAPVGSKVTVKIGGKTYTMKSAATISNGSGIYPTTFTYVYTIPTYKGTPRIVDLGKPVYTMKYKKITNTRKAPASIGVIIMGAPYYAEVTKTAIDTYNTPISGNGAAYELYSGMIDNITGMTGSYIRLASGQWVKKTSVKTTISKTRVRPTITKAEYITGEKWDSLKLDTTGVPAAIGTFDGTVLKMSISASPSGSVPIMPENSLFSTASVAASDNKVEYTLTLKADQRIDGYCVEKTTTGLVLNIKRHVKANSAIGALSGITIMVDPGHGGSENGAVGPLGTKYAEKTINFNTSLKLKDELEKMGATVLMTRTGDTGLSLVERLTASRNAKPDMFISIHSNSMEDNVDISKVSGFSAYYHYEIAQTLTQGIYNSVIGELNRKAMGVHVKNFYVMRGTWAPSLLLEGGFVPNPVEFEWLSDENMQTQYAKSIATAIAGYFAN